MRNHGRNWESWTLIITIYIMKIISSCQVSIITVRNASKLPAIAFWSWQIPVKICSRWQMTVEIIFLEKNCAAWNRWSVNYISSLWNCARVLRTTKDFVTQQNILVNIIFTKRLSSIELYIKDYKSLFICSSTLSCRLMNKQTNEFWERFFFIFSFFQGSLSPNRSIMIVPWFLWFLSLAASMQAWNNA